MILTSRRSGEKSKNGTRFGNCGENYRFIEMEKVELCDLVSTRA